MVNSWLAAVAEAGGGWKDRAGISMGGDSGTMARGGSASATSSSAGAGWYSLSSLWTAAAASSTTGVVEATFMMAQNQESE